MEEIDKDVKRTFPHLHFFNKDGEVGSTRHYEALRRILFIYAKLNPGICYVQGEPNCIWWVSPSGLLTPFLSFFFLLKRNEWSPWSYLLCLCKRRFRRWFEFFTFVFWVHSTDFGFFASFPSDAAESDAFHCFKNLMSEIRDNFCKTLDQSDLGVAGILAKFNSLLKVTDYEIWNHLVSPFILFLLFSSLLLYSPSPSPFFSPNTSLLLSISPPSLSCFFSLRSSLPRFPFRPA